MEAYTYLTLAGDLVDLRELTEEERAFFARCWQAYREGVDWDAFTALAEGMENPVVRDLGRGRITNAVWAHPMFRAVRDLEDRVGIRTGDLEPDPGDDPGTDPVADAWLSVREAAGRKGVSFSGLDQAIRRGEVIAHPARPGGVQRVVSARSLERWRPMTVRQEAGRARRKQTAVRHLSRPRN